MKSFYLSILTVFMITSTHLPAHADEEESEPIHRMSTFASPRLVMLRMLRYQVQRIRENSKQGDVSPIYDQIIDPILKREGFGITELGTSRHELHARLQEGYGHEACRILKRARHEARFGDLDRTLGYERRFKELNQKAGMFKQCLASAQEWEKLRAPAHEKAACYAFGALSRAESSAEAEKHLGEYLLNSELERSLKGSVRCAKTKSQLYAMTEKPRAREIIRALRRMNHAQRAQDESQLRWATTAYVKAITTHEIRTKEERQVQTILAVSSQ